MKKRQRYLLAGLAVLACVTLGLGAWVFYLYLTLPPVAWLRHYRPPELMAAAKPAPGERPALRYDLPLRCIPKRLQQAFIAAEDSDFWNEGPVDYDADLRAALVDLVHGSWVQGASTITQQVARNLFLSPSKTLTRKIEQVLLAYRLNAALGKPQILDLYLNMIYLGEGTYGVSAASCAYYGKPVWRLDLAQMAMLAGLPAAPSVLNPVADPALARRRRAYVLQRMAALGDISEQAARAAMAAPISTHYHPQRGACPSPRIRHDCACDCASGAG